MISIGDLVRSRLELRKAERAERKAAEDYNLAKEDVKVAREVHTELWRAFNVEIDAQVVSKTEDGK